MELSSYLLFNGECAAAFKFYEKHLGGKIEGMITYAGSPGEEQVPAEWREKVMHARMTVGESALMASDAPRGTMKNRKAFPCRSSLRIRSTENASLTRSRKAERW
jgi:PhnB protein